MFLPRYQLKSFESLPWDWKIGVLKLQLEALVLANRAYLYMNPRTPQMYMAGIVYVRDPPGVEDWKDVPMILYSGWADCKSLASWRVAELRNAGEGEAIPYISYRKSPGMTMYHIAVRRRDGTIEDPSRILGMR